MQRQRFEPEKVETFSLQKSDIGDLEVVEIEHDGETLANSWFLDDITIEMPTKGRAFCFACHEWLSKEKVMEKLNVYLKIQICFLFICIVIPYEVTFSTGDLESAGCDCDVSLKLFGTTGSSSEHIIRKEERNFERGSIDPFQCELDDVGEPIKLRVTILPKGKKGRHSWFLQNIELIKHTKENERQKTYLFDLNDWISKETDYHHDIPLTKGGKALLKETTYRETVKTTDISGASCECNVFIVISEYVQIDDTRTGETYMFPCNKWLSSKKEDRQIVRELVCSNDSPNTNLRGLLTASGKVPYEIEISTSDKQHAGTTQHGWIILEGNKKRSEKFYMKNEPHIKILRGGQTDTFTFECRSLGELRRIILGHKERPEYPLNTYEGRGAMWHVAHVTVTDPSTGVKFEFLVRKWIDINNQGNVFECAEKKEDTIAQQCHRHTIKYKIIVHTSDVSHAGTDANVSIILYGTLGDTGIRELKQKGPILFERGQVDEFIIEL
ncbi:unnamed protein product [Adineta steineri]|uniref:PLAT domain-containing protein n=1 Tax=Adineta steineri TaxID=433720 RepID=A0A815JK71_9BILA|nr:unnamed protein product [Adineta steineri]CAF1608431.1 unnamed protein product [Adineta steineri]